MSNSETSWTARKACQASLSLTISCPLSWWCHPTIPSSVTPFTFAFNLSQHEGLFQWVSSSQSGGQSIGVSASASVLPVNIQGWFPLGSPCSLISLQSKGLSRFFSSATIQKHQFFGTRPSLHSNFHICPWLWTNGKTIALTMFVFL